jgi:hypothetical protein
LLLVTAASARAATNVTIDRATVPGGTGRRVLISVTYACDAASGVRQLVATAEDTATGASGEGQVPATCDGGSHFTDVTVDSGTAETYRRFREITATARLAAGNGTTVAGAADRKVLYPH